MQNPILFLQDLAVILLAATLAGMVCRRLGVSPIVGYLTAGLIVGTPEIAFPYVTDEDRIAVIAQLGVLFLMFSIGLQFRLRRIREMGLHIIFSTLIAAFLILSMVRVTAEILGLDLVASLILAAVFMNSSSAIISKVLQEKGLDHERPGQLALGTTLLEDIVSVIMLAIIGSFLVMDEGGTTARSPLATIGLLTGFTIGIYIFGTLILPGLLRLTRRSRSSEGMTLLVAASLLSIALLSIYAGFSLALGAFLAGMIFAETRQRSQIERTFSGLKDLFLTLFFVTVGMMADVHLLPPVLPWIALGIGGAILGRSFALWVGLLVVGEHPRNALRAALCLTPLGEFSFILAGIAVAGGILGPAFQATVVGVVLGTSLISPLIAQHSLPLSRFLEKRPLQWLARWHDLLQSSTAVHNPFQSRKSRALGLRKRFSQILIELVIVSAILVFAGELINWIAGALPWQPALPAKWILWTILGLVLLLPLSAVWRNLSATSLLLAGTMRGGGRRDERSTLLIAGVIRSVASLLILIWLWNLLPSELPRLWILGATVFLAIPITLLAWRKFIRLHSGLEWVLNENLNESERFSIRSPFADWEESDWGLNIREICLPDESRWAGQPLHSLNLRQKTGASIVGIQRHGYTVSSVGPSTHLFPGDELLLLGSDPQIREAEKILLEQTASADAFVRLESQILKSVKVDSSNPLKGGTLGQLTWARDFGVQVVSLRREGQTRLGLDASTRFLEGDTLLLLGPPEGLRRLQESWGAVSAKTEVSSDNV